MTCGFLTEPTIAPAGQLRAHSVHPVSYTHQMCIRDRYYAWSPFDLYSWKNGTEKRYGLVAIDYENGLERRPKKSYYWYKDVIETDGKHITGK